MRRCASVVLLVAGAASPSMAQLFGTGGGGSGGTGVSEKSGTTITPVGGGAGTGTGDAGDESEDGSEDTDETDDGGIIFSVDPDSVGVGSRLLPDVGVHHQFIRRQQSGDAFCSTEAWNLIEGRLPPPTSLGLLDDVLIINQNLGWTDSIGFGLEPAVSPFITVPMGTVFDDIDCLAKRENNPQGRPRLYFTVTNDSPSLLTLPGPPVLGRGSDIFFDPDIQIGNNEQLYVTGQALGLMPGDEIDGLMVFDTNNNRVYDGADRVLFSLDRGSPSLPLRGFSAADVLVSFNHEVTIFASHFELGLEASDNIDALLWRPLVGGNMQSTIDFLLAGLAVCPADLSGSADPGDPTYASPDGIVDASDFFYFLDQFVINNLEVADLSGSADPNDPSYGNPDGAIDASDFFYFLDIFSEGCS